MKEFFGTIATDKINKYNEIFPLSTMINAYENQWSDCLPYTVNHDRTRCIGYSKMSGVFIEPHTAYLTVKAFIGDSSSDAQIINEHLSVNNKKMVDHNAEKHEKLRELLRPYLSHNYIWLTTDSVAIHDIGIARKVLPKIWEQCDNDGLVPLINLEPVLPGIFRVGNLLLYAHSYFRRNLSRINSLNEPFLSKLQEVCKTNHSVKIALDPDVIGLVGSQDQTREYAYWWGPKFTDDLASIPTGVTCFDNDKYDTLFSPIRQTECGWYTQDDRRTFECEEIVDSENIKSSGEGLFGCRYVHSMLSSHKGTIPNHLDGAIRAYTTEKMISRLGISIKDAERNTDYSKLWRIDGEIPVPLWKDLITNFYRDNQLIGEYFSGIDASSIVEKKNPPDHQRDDFDEYIPVQICSGFGIRTNISIHEEATLESGFDIVVKPTKYIQTEDPLKCYIESGTLSLIKLLERKGLRIFRPSCNKIEYYDTAFNFPLFVCSTSENGNAIISCIYEFCKKWCDRKDDRVISYSIQVNYSEYSIKFSFIGHINDFLLFFDSCGLSLPQAPDDLPNWANQVYSNMNKLPYAIYSPPNGRIVRRNGELYYNRIYVPNDIFLGCKNSEEGLYPELNISADDAARLESYGICAAPVLGNIKTKCSRCMINYENCDCVKFIDSNCDEIIEDGELLGCFWTTRPEIIQTRATPS